MENRKQRLLIVQVHRMIRFDLPDKSIREIVRTVFQGEGREEKGILSIVFADDATLQDLNARFLGKERPTDVMAFPLNDKENFWGEIYISVERAKANSIDYRVPFLQELARYVIHGVLHLLGYGDKTKQEKKRMWEKEDTYLKKINSIFQKEFA